MRGRQTDSDVRQEEDHLQAALLRQPHHTPTGRKSPRVKYFEIWPTPPGVGGGKYDGKNLGKKTKKKDKKK